MDSPLSFNSSENFRKRLLTRNLKPYRVDDSFSFGDVAQNKEFQIVDYAVKDSVEVSTIGNVQEKELYKQNKYGPENSSSTYGDTIQINVNLNVESNFGLYGFTNSIGSQLEKIGDGQEKLLFVNNIYGPTEFSTSYGDTVEINKNLQQETNKGKYGYPLAIGSELEKIGDTKEKELIVTNLYKPLNRNNRGYGDTVWYINDNQTILSRGKGQYTISDAQRSFLNSIGNQQEILLKVKNTYQKISQNSSENDFGLPVYNINDLKTITTNGSGEYSPSDAVNSILNNIGNQRETILKILNVYKPSYDNFGSPVFWIQNNQIISTHGSGLYLNSNNANGSSLETKGNEREIALKVINKYTPAGTGQDYGTTKYSINNILSLGANEGPYYPTTAIGSELELFGVETREIIYPINQYGPDGGFTTTFYPWTNYQTNSNEKEYDPSDAVNSNLEINAETIRLNLFPINQYGPVNGQSQTEVNINNNLQTNSNEGNYDSTDSINSELEQDANETRLSLIPLNEYNSQNFPTNTVDINVNLGKLSNEGEYGFPRTKGSELELVGSQKENEAYSKNKYVTGEGSYEVITIEDIVPSSYGNPYANSLTPINFIPSTYTPINILLSDNPTGSNGSLSQDSALASIGARQLRKEYKYRIASELLSQTLGRINALDSEIDPDSGEVSVKPNLNPFDAAGIISGNIPLLARNYVITSPESLIGRALNFTAKLGGLYSPYSIIPGEYFDYPNKRMLNRLVENPVEVVTNTVMGAIRTITGQKNKRGSKLMLANTSNATRSLLFGQLFYNTFRPDYKGLTLRRPSLFAPKPNFYGGGDSDDIFSTLISPPNAQPLDKNGEPSGAPVYSVGEIGKYYEGENFQKYKFGLNTRNYYDGTTTIGGGFTWSSKRGYFKVGEKAGPGGLQKFGGVDVFTKNFESAFKDTESWKIEENNVWRDGSILDTTQKLVDSADRNGIKKLEHVGTAINQISKVFNDGYVEMTKGSRVIKYTTKNSIDSASGSLQGFEYCRLFTKDNPYLNYEQLQKTDGNIRKYSYSVLDNTYNLNIAPFNDKNGQSTNIIEGQVKKYMLSLENLAWRTSNKPGFTTEDLPACERGPNGGRIMWFPPYNLEFSDSSRAEFGDTSFIGRPEKIYTYKTTTRGGKLDFDIIVDHPSISNLLVDQEFKDIRPESEMTKVIDSFFAGCLKYDLYTLTRRFAFLAPQDIQTAINLIKYPEQATTIVKETPEPEPTKTEEVKSTPPASNEKISDPKFEEIFLFFENAQPNDSSGTSTSKDFEFWYNQYVANKNNYTTVKPLNKVFKYLDANKVALDTNTTPNFSLKEYVDTRKETVGGFFSNIETEFQDLKEFLGEVFNILNGGGEVSFDLLGTASSTNQSGNQPLSERRNDAVLKFIENFKVDNTILKTFTEGNSPKLRITKKAEGSSGTIKDPKYSEIECNKAFKSPYEEGIYSVQAMACRRTKIGNVTFKAAPPVQSETPPAQTESAAPNPTAAETTAPKPTPQNEIINNFKQTPQYKDLAKKIIRRLLTECNYFQMVKETNPFLYDGIRSKFKYFNPAFHSMTPEGLNSRLVFLQQCMRPGDTIPTVSQTAGGSIKYDYNDAFNSAFGSPPILVLRVGDFYHTKIVPNDLQISYSNQAGALFDLNPEGIGVQPMVANISLSFDMIGGHGLAGPVAELQNALSFNYYANTEMYDERATITEDVTSQYDAEFFEAIRTNPLAKPQQLQQNKIGTTIGKQDTYKYDTTLSGFTGVLSYKENMKNFIDLTKDYAKNVFENLKNINSKLLIGGILIFTKDRKYQNGYFNNINQPATNLVKIFGKSEYEEKVDLLFSGAKDDIENEGSPILAGLATQNFTNISTRKIKRKLKDMIESRQSTYLSVLNDASNNIVNSEVNETKMIDVLDQLNYVCNAFDGYANDKNEILVFSLTGTTPVDASYANTLDELRGDLQKIGSKLSAFTNNLETYSLIPTDNEESYNDNFQFNTFINSDPLATTNKENRFFMVFGKEIIDDYNKFVNEVVDVVNNNERKTEWANYLKTTLGINPQDDSELPTGIVAQYKSSKDFVDKRFESFETNYYNSVFCATCSYDINKDKERKMNFSQVLFPNQIEVDNMKAINSSVNSTGDEYNLKVSFN
jgi:hypothetical protein